MTAITSPTNNPESSRAPVDLEGGITGETTARNTLLTWAFVSDSLSKSSTLLDGLMPLFSPIVDARAGAVFNQTVFLEDVSHLYGLSINPLAVPELVSALAKAGMLVRAAQDRSGSVSYLYAARRGQRAGSAEINQVLDDLIDRFEKFASKLSSIRHTRYTRDEIENMLLDTIVDRQINVGLISAMDRREENSKGYQSFKYTMSRFLLDLETRNPDMIDKISQLSSAQMVSEIVLDLRQPPGIRSKASDLRIYIDGPIGMALLGLTGRESKENTTSLLSQMNTLNCAVCIYSHSIDEIRAIVNAILDADPALRNGSMGDALRNGEILETYARQVGDQPRIFPKKLGIAIDNTQLVRGTKFVGFFTDPMINRLKAQLFGWMNDISRDRDARSAGYTVRYRRGVYSNDPLKAKYIFVTDNPALARITHTFCVSEGLMDRYHAGPVITLRRLAALLWLTLGGVKDQVSLSRRQLLANCALTVRSRPDVIGKMIRVLQNVHPDLVGQIRLLLSLPRSSQMAMDVTLGDDAAISDATIDEILREIRRVALEEEHQRVEKISSEHEKKLETVEGEFQKTVFELQNKINQLAQDHARDVAREKDRLGVCVSEIYNVQRRLVMLVQIIGSIAVTIAIMIATFILASLISVKPMIAYGAAVFIGVLTALPVLGKWRYYFWGPDSVRGVLQRFSDPVLRRRAENRGLGTYLTGAVVDWRIGAVTWGNEQERGASEDAVRVKPGYNNNGGIS